ncbi:MAG: type II secretion system F family protein [Alphaproteobacteria bacterium GM7ARS4]|nr:type II secretion system F family protein [Alphaproteobacteria bacterium GM7ARS4]
MLEFLSDPSVLFGIVLLVGVAVMLLSDDDPLERRMRQVRRGLKKKGIQGDTEEEEDVTSMVKEELGKVVHVAKKTIKPVQVLGEEGVHKMTAQLRAAGYRGTENIIIFILWKIFAAILLGGLTLIWIFSGVESLTPLDYGLFFGALTVGWFSIDFGVRFLANKRRLRLRKTLPDAVDILLICVRSGMTFEASMQRIIVEMGDFHKDIVDEFSLTLSEMQYLNERTDALRNFADRVGLDEVKSFAATIIQADKHGTSISDGLTVFSEEMRKARLFEIEKWSAKVPTLMTLPMALFLLPVFFIITLGPGIISALNAF